MARHGRFEMWVEIDGQRVQERGYGVNGRTASFFIVSKVDAKVAVYVREHPSSTPARARVDVYMEGAHVGQAVLDASGSPCCFMGSWLNEDIVRPFVFTKANIERDDSSETPERAGKIVAEIRQITLISAKGRAILPPELDEWQPPAIDEDDETVERHSIVLSDTAVRQIFRRQITKFKDMPFDDCDPEPVASFEVSYGSEDFVFRSLRELGSSGSYFDSNGVNFKYGPPRKRPRFSSPPVVSTPSSSDEDGCSRCISANILCVPNGGTSLTCQRCKKLHLSCDLPAKTPQSAARKHSRVEPIVSIVGHEKRGLHDDSRNDSKGLSASRKTQRSKSTPCRRFQRPELGQSSSEDDSNTSELTEDQDRIVRRQSRVTTKISTSSAGAAGATRASSFQERRELIREDPSSSSEVPVTIRPNTSATVNSKALIRPTPSSSDTKAGSSTSFQVSKIVQLIRSFSDQLMELTAENDQEGIAEVSDDLISKCDSSVRKLQGLALQRKRVNIGKYEKDGR